MAILYVRTVNLTKYGIYYTADCIVPDGSDTGIHGDGCEPGSGARLESGWISPRWSMTRVHESHRDVSPDRFESAWDGNPRRWLADRLAERLPGGVGEANRLDCLYSAESADYDGIDVSVCAHPYGFADWEIESALNMLASDEIARTARYRRYLARTGG